MVGTRPPADGLVWTLTCPDTRRAGFVSYDNRDSAEKAISQMNGYQVGYYDSFYDVVCILARQRTARGEIYQLPPTIFWPGNVESLMRLLRLFVQFRFCLGGDRFWSVKTSWGLPRFHAGCCCPFPRIRLAKFNSAHETTALFIVASLCMYFFRAHDTRYLLLLFKYCINVQ